MSGGIVDFLVGRPEPKVINYHNLTPARFYEVYEPANAANLALVAFSRMWGGEDGQVFALIVMVVAACEVTVGLGLIVAIYRRRMPIDVDELNELQG